MRNNGEATAVEIENNKSKSSLKVVANDLANNSAIEDNASNGDNIAINIAKSDHKTDKVTNIPKIGDKSNDKKVNNMSKIKSLVSENDRQNVNSLSKPQGKSAPVLELLPHLIESVGIQKYSTVLEMPRTSSKRIDNTSIEYRYSHINEDAIDIDTKVDGEKSEFELGDGADINKGGKTVQSTECLDAVGLNTSNINSRLTCHLSTEKSTLENKAVYENPQESHVTRSTNQKREGVLRKDIRLVSPKLKKLSPKISPKSKLKLSHSNKKHKKQSDDKNKIKTNVNSIKKVKEIIKTFEANTVVNVDANTSTNAVLKKEKCKDAFEALMERSNTGDTPRKTPVRTRVKRLENITSSNQSILKWVSKSGRKGDHF